MSSSCKEAAEASSVLGVGEVFALGWRLWLRIGPSLANARANRTQEAPSTSETPPNSWPLRAQPDSHEAKTFRGICGLCRFRACRWSRALRVYGLNTLSIAFETKSEAQIARLRAIWSLHPQHPFLQAAWEAARSQAPPPPKRFVRLYCRWLHAAEATALNRTLQPNPALQP